ncbi:hypothetical protein [Paradesulfitobacterium ferrireducens]|uniref:hypothetical protein n=1 Tax=Paradesulfitobacterium ferrireducens TaxID=2816476 RepID=UPI001A8C6402|nr:hypothetical protein [Paradesulfitobacterium ferrireducens]
MRVNKRVIFIIFLTVAISTGLLIRLFPSEQLLKEKSIKSIEYANNFSWDSYTGNEGAVFFSQDAQKKFFGKSVDIEYIQKVKEKSEGYIESFVAVNPSFVNPVTKFISYRKIEDINGTIEFRTLITYKFKLENFNWVIDEVEFERM